MLFLRLSDTKAGNMSQQDFLEIVGHNLGEISLLEFTGLVTGLLAVVWLIRQHILTWPTGIIYVIVSLAIFWKEKLYADFALHIIYLFLNIYGWYYWKHGKHSGVDKLPVTATPLGLSVFLVILSAFGIGAMGYLLQRYTDASLPYWDSATTVLSFTGMWLTARKKIENWYYWFVVDILATGIYYYKGIYLYAFLYVIYIGLAVVGYVNWRQSMKKEKAI